MKPIPEPMDFLERVMSTTLNDDEKSAIRARRQAHKEDVEQFAVLSDAALAEKAAYYFQNCERCRWPAGSPVYDAVMAHVIIPEMIKRLRD